MDKYLLDTYIVEELKKQRTSIATYVVANLINMNLPKKKEGQRTDTNKVRARLKNLEKKGIVKTVPTSYKVQLSWVIVREKVSNCCNEPIEENTDICTKCKEHCEAK